MLLSSPMGNPPLNAVSNSFFIITDLVLQYKENLGAQAFLAGAKPKVADSFLIS